MPSRAVANWSQIAPLLWHRASLTRPSPDGASAPMGCSGWESKSEVQFVPPSVVFQMPPDAAPTK